MQTKTLKVKLAKVAMASALASLGAATVIAGGTIAGADPKLSEDPVIGMGSDTTQDVLDAFTGEVNGRQFIPLRTSEATGHQQLASWRAVNEDGATCVEPAGGILVDRPNGSGNGRRALTAAWFGGGWGRTDVGCTPTYDNMSGLIDFARSSSGKNEESGDLTYVPFARDALQFAYSAPDAASAVSTLTTAQIQGLHTTSGAAYTAPNGTRVIACRIQDGSGTYETWAGFMGLGDGTGSNKTTLVNATAECATEFDVAQTAIDGIQEHDPNGLEDVCDRIRAQTGKANTQCIIGYSAANFVAQYNGVGSRSLPVQPTASTGGQFNLGVNSDLTVGANAPAYVLNGGTAEPNDLYYVGTWGRDVFNVIPTYIIGDPSYDRIFEMLLGDGPDFDTLPDYDNGDGGPAMCTGEAATIKSLLGFGDPVRECGAYGAFLKGPRETKAIGPVGSAENAANE